MAGPVDMSLGGREYVWGRQSAWPEPDPGRTCVLEPGLWVHLWFLLQVGRAGESDRRLGILMTLEGQCLSSHVASIGATEVSWAQRVCDAPEARLADLRWCPLWDKEDRQSW